MHYSIYFAVIICLGISGCAGVPTSLPEEQVTLITQNCSGDATCVVEQTDKAMAKLLEDYEYDRAEAEIRRKEDVLAYIQGCRSQGLVLISVARGPTSISERRWKSKRWDELTIHDISRHMRVHDFQCGTAHQAMEAVRSY